ncbi:heparan-alpha-glucosaminide N-acetyltransferase domain-containing protein [Luethyella okanaganae]|uniref:Heparan-alpha-glucosaminide N-acetyltransferase domain-containing protein n=1 Tax=Luethyella okanaganae TaxID=69372 RepID=A0ABW1VE19_9MICO
MSASELTSSSPSGRRQMTGRIVGIDLARFLALAGMMATHLWTILADDPSARTWLSEVLAGKAAALFALLAGVGIAITTRGYLAAGRAASARWAVFGRGFALVLIGMTLGLVPGGIIVILVYYGVTFWCVIPMLRWSNTVLLVVAAAWAGLWPFLSSLIRNGLEQQSGLGSANWAKLDDPAGFVRGLLVTGAYPVATWVVYTMVGIVVGRLVLAANRQQARHALGFRLVVVGSALAAAALGLSLLLLGPLGGIDNIASTLPSLPEYPNPQESARMFVYGAMVGTVPGGSIWWLASPAPHSGTFFDLAITSGIAVATIGLCLLVGAMLRPLARRILSPVSSAGSAPLTVYVLHVVIVGAVTGRYYETGIPEGVVPWDYSSLELWLLHIAGALVIGTLLVLLGRRGPLETLVSWVGKQAARLGRRPAGADASAELPPTERGEHVGA